MTIPSEDTSAMRRQLRRLEELVIRLGADTPREVHQEIEDIRGELHRQTLERAVERLYRQRARPVE